MADQVKIMLLKLEIPKLLRALGKTQAAQKLTDTKPHPERLMFELVKDRWWISYQKQVGTRKEPGYYRREVPIFEPDTKEVDWNDPVVERGIQRIYLALNNQLRERTMDRLVRETIKREYGDLIDPAEILQ